MIQNFVLDETKARRSVQAGSLHFRFTWFWFVEHTSNMLCLIDCLRNFSSKLISTVAGDVQKNLAGVRNCHCHLDSIAIVCIAKMLRRTTRIAVRSLPYEASTINAAGSVEDNPSSDENAQESVIQFDSCAFAKLPRHNPYSGFVSL